ncbi:MAG: ribose-phosphate pyrophosphokinase [Deltaproteobacteria bacterium]|nr:ribose-phosphate pyrophosphokinase [Deltaproteobacteria bacterium]
MNKLKIFAGNSNPKLANDICRSLRITLGAAEVRRFSDGEVFVEIQENVRGVDVFLIQSTCPPTNDHLMEVLVMTDALKRASAGRITTVLPYYGYARQDRKVAPRTPISAKLVANLFTAAGTDRILTVDLHAGQIQGFFDIPVDNLYAAPVLVPYLQNRIKNSAVVVSPDAGGVERARAFAKRLNATLAIIDKRRIKANVAEVMHIIGDVEGKKTILVDDMVDTAGTLTQAASALIEKGAAEVYACSTHAVLSGEAIERLKASKIVEFIVTDTIPLSPEAQALTNIKVLSIAGLLGEAMKRIHDGESVSSLFI